MKDKIIQKNNSWKRKRELDFIDWFTLGIALLSTGFVVYQILRG